MHLREQLYRQPRTADRLFVCAGTDTVRLEGLYDAMPFYCMYAAMFDQSKVFDDIVLQYEVTDEYTLDTSTGLNYGACRDGRAAAREPDMRQTGLYMAGLMDVLEYFPWDHPFREKAEKCWRGWRKDCPDAGWASTPCGCRAKPGGGCRQPGLVLRHGGGPVCRG